MHGGARKFDHDIYGEDAFQALLLALANIQNLVQHCGPTLTWPGHGDPGFSLAGVG